MAPNVLNDALLSGGGLSMGVVENYKMNETQSAADAAAQAASYTKNAPAAASTTYSLATEAAPNASADAPTADELAAVYTPNYPTS